MTGARRTRLLLVAALLVLLAAAGYAGLRYVSERHVVLNGYRSGSWIAVQAEQELLRFGRAVAAYRAAPGPESRARVSLRLQLFWSRIPLILTGEEARGLRALSGVEPKVRGIAQRLPEVQAAVARLGGPGEAAALGTIARLTDSFEAPLADLTRDAVLQDAFHYNRRQLSRLLTETGAILGLLVLGGAGLVAALWRQLAVSQRQAAHNAHLSMAAARTRDGVAITDADGVFIYMNAAHATIFGYDRPEELIGRAWTSLYPAHEVRRLTDEAMPAVAATGGWSGETDGLARDGRVVQQEITLSRMDGGGLVCVTRDVGGRRAMEEELRQNAEELRAQAARLERLQQQRAELVAAVEAADIGVMICEAGAGHTPIRQVNAAFTRVTGYAAEQAIGRDPRFLQGEGSDPAAIAEMRQAVDQGRRTRLTILNYRADGTAFWNDMIVVPLPGDDGRLRAWVGVAIDASEGVRLERERTQLIGQFYQAQKMEALGRLAGGVAHDLNNVLAIMMGFATLLRDDDREETHRYAGRIVEAGERGKDVIQRLLAFSRREQTETRERLDLARVLDEMGGLLCGAITHPAEVRIDARVRSAEVLANGNMVEQALINLCVNARDALPEPGGTIALTLDRHEVAEPGPAGEPGAGGEPRRLVGDAGGGHLWLGRLEPGSYARLEVRDTGSGMSAEVLDQIFDPFFTTKPKEKGTGLGMSTIQQMVYAHAGAIEVESRIGTGTCFTLYLPLAGTGQPPAPTPAPVTAVPAAGVGEAILLVDDEPDLLAVTKAALERRGYTVLTATGTEAALATFAESGGHVVATVTDYAMPGRNGLELARELSRRDESMAIIVLTGVVEDLDAEAVAEAGVDAVLQKPCPLGELFRLLGHEAAA